MNDNFMTPFDLVGDPIPEGWGKRGRPAHIPTHENHNRISRLLAFRRANRRISQALRITGAALRRYYFRVLVRADAKFVGGEIPTTDQAGRRSRFHHGTGAFRLMLRAAIASTSCNSAVSPGSSIPSTASSATVLAR